jgi:hypothetical protein
MKIQKPLLFFFCAGIFLLISLLNILPAFSGVNVASKNLQGGIGASGFLFLGIYSSLGKNKGIGFIVGIVLYVFICFVSAFLAGYFRQ